MNAGRGTVQGEHRVWDLIYTQRGPCRFYAALRSFRQNYGYRFGKLERMCVNLVDAIKRGRE